MSDCHGPDGACPSAAGGTPSGLERRVCLIGNPNTGKSTLFAELTGARVRIGNYPGVTVDRRSASLRGAPEDAPIEVVDLPGAYSLSARSAEEQIALGALLGLDGGPPPDLALVVLDATQLARNLYLAVQVLELGVPAVLCLNMIDEAGDSAPDPAELSRWLGVPCVATDARSGVGIAALRDAVIEALRTPRRAGALALRYSPEVEHAIARLRPVLPDAWQGSEARVRGLVLWLLLSVSEDDELRDIPPELRREVLGAQQEAGPELDTAVIRARYALIDAKLAELAERRAARGTRPSLRPALSVTDRIDRVLLHPVLGFGVFVAVMFLVFVALFQWATPAIDLVDALVALAQRTAEEALPAGLFADLVANGIIGGVGNVLVFLPQILLLFFFIGLLEDSGYMARVAYLMDRVMKVMGLHGRAFVPMLSGFACAVPAILATRTMERQRDRLLTMLVVPLMSCSARLPVYTLIIAALFPARLAFGFLPVQGALMVGIYLFSTTIAILAAGVLGRTAVKGRRVPLLLELPPYRAPRLKSLVRMMTERAMVFVKQAGTIILACSVVMWALLSFPRPPAEAEEQAAVARASATAPEPAKSPSREDETALSVSHARAGGAPEGAMPSLEPASQASPSAVATTGGPEGVPAIRYSFGAMLGHAIEPVLRPLGFDWKLGVGLIGAFVAREVFISTLALVYGVDDSTDEAAPLRDRIRDERLAGGQAAYTPLVGLSLLVFFALSCQCMSTLAVVRRETKSWRWPLFLFGYMTTLAWVVSFLVYQGGRLLGFS